jgi:2-(1,2-epoxy-1,2-dihydrophenyl)acetyl-CoA isomerase
MTPHLVEQMHDRVATLTLNRPERLNALSPEMIAALRDALLRHDADAGVGAVVLTGAGRGFCSGGDVKRMADAPPIVPGADAVAILREKMDVARLLHEIGKPTIAMVNGPAAGAGMALALACDLRIAGASARFTTAFAKVCLPGDFGGSYFLSLLAGSAHARELYFTGDVIDAEQARALGLVNRVVPDADLEATTMALARRIAAGPALALAAMKRNLNAAQGDGLAAVLDLEARQQIEAGATEDHREAARAFVEKRRPVFKGR